MVCNELMAEVLLDQPEVDAGLEEMSRVTMSERVDRDGLAEPQVADDAAHGALDAGAFHGADRRWRPGGGRGRWRGRARWDGDAWPSTRGGPRAWPRAGDEAVLGPLAVVDVDHHAVAVDVADLEVEALAEPEAQRVDGPEVGAVVGRADGGDEASDLVDGEDVGEAGLAGDAEAFEGGPVSRAV